MAETAPHDHRRRRFILAVAAITILGLALRLAYVWFWRRQLAYGGDALYYHASANLLAEGRGFVHPFAAMIGIDTPGADHPPLYSMFLAAFSLVGLKSVTQHLVASALLGTVAIPLAALVGRRIGARFGDTHAGGRRVALVAAALVAFYPNIWRYDGTLMSETIVIVAVLVVLLTSFRYLDAPSTGRFALVGLALGFAAGTRSELLLLVPIVLPLLAIAAPVTTVDDDGTARSRRWSVLAVGSIVALAVVLPWPVYNLTRFDTPVLFTTNAGGTFAVSNCDAVYYGPNMGYWDYNCGTAALEREGIDPMREGAEADKAMRQAGVDYLLDHKGRVPVVVAARLGRILDVFQPFGQADLDVAVEATEPPVADAGVWSFWLVGGLAVGGAILMRRERLRLAVLLTPVAVVLVASAVFYATTRFRASAEPSLCLLAAVALVAAFDRIAHLYGRADSSRDGQPPVGDVDEADAAAVISSQAEL